MTAPRSVSLNLEDVVARQSQTIGELSTRLIIAEVTRDVVLADNDKLKVELSAPQEADIPADENTKHAGDCGLAAAHTGECKPSTYRTS